MDSLDYKITNKLQQAIHESRILEHFQYGHNLLQSSVQIDEIFSMINSIIDKVLEVVDDIIPDLNLAPYKEGYVDPNRANLCWIELQDGYYGLILNTHLGIKFRQFDKIEIQNLLLTGQLSSWYLVSKIQNLSYLLANDGDENITVEYFRQLIIDIIERFMSEHENNKKYHPLGKVDADHLQSVFAKVQIQNTSSILPAAEEVNDEKNGAVWSQSLIKTQTNEICWQSSPNFRLYQVDASYASKILTSNYLNECSDVEAFLESTYKKRKGSANKPNEFCFISRENFDVPYVDMNYVVECQLRGFIEVKYSNDEIVKIYPDTQPFVIDKGKNNISFITVIKLDNNITRQVKEIVTKNTTIGKMLPDLCLVCSFTGISKVF